MNIFITGESGTIPMALQRLATNFNCKVLNTQLEDNFLTELKKHQSFKVRKPELDFLDRDLFLNNQQLWDQTDLIVHSGAFVGTDFCNSDPTLAIRTNVEGTQNIVDVCNLYDIPLIYLSTTAILDPEDYGDSKPMSEITEINPQTLYGITKYAGELIVQNTCKTEKLILRPVFGFGNYPDDLHSALTKIIYVIYRNLKVEETELTVLLDKNIPKSYTRVENIATCILQFAPKVLTSDCTDRTINIGEDYRKALNWYSLREIISYQFAIKNICSQREAQKYFDDCISFSPDQDYLHYHNIDNEFLKSFGQDFDSQENYISISQGISYTLDSVIDNFDKEPYWLGK